MAKQIYECEHCRTTFGNKEDCEEHELVCGPLQHIKKEGKIVMDEAMSKLRKIEKHHAFNYTETYEHGEFVGYTVTMIYV